MPRPTPPPPPQPSVEETAAGVRLVFGLMPAFALLFALIASQYHVRGWAVEYGRENGASWNLYKLDRTSERKLRGEDGEGKVAWLVGSSILRDSFDEGSLNATLEFEGSDWRVAKFGQTRGAGGLGWGIVRELPLKPGDRVIHNVSMENFRQDWLDFTGLPGWRVQLMLKPAELLAIEEWSWQTRMEELVAVPREFYRYHEEHMGGVMRWVYAPFVDKWPRPRRRSMHLTSRSVGENSNLERARARGERSRYFLSDDKVDLSDSQFNIVGIERMRSRCAELGVDFHLIDVPPRQEYMATFMTEGVRNRWDEWRAQQPDLAYFPQLPEDDYYDMKHPASSGRAALSAVLIEWLDEPIQGRPAPLEWSPETP